MAQSDYSIGANPTGLAMREEVNTIFQSVLTNNSGATAPTTTAAFMYWVDTSNATTYYLKMRNHDNTDWVVLANYTVSTKTLTAIDTTKIPIDLSGATSKVTPVDADLLPLSDSAASFGLKKLSWLNVKATLKTYFDTLYLNLFAISKGVSDANTLSSGRNYVSSASTNIPIASVGFIDCIAIEGSNIMQVFTTVSAGESATAIQYVRTGNYITNTWTAWTKQYSQRNIIGSVSQSSGVPTGAIIEQGSNANGEWTKYADGTIDGTTIFTADLTANTVSGSLFIVTGSLTIPTTLASISDVQLVAQRVSGGVVMVSLQSGGFTTSGISLYLIGSTTGTVGKAKARFKGRWY